MSLIAVLLLAGSTPSEPLPAEFKRVCIEPNTAAAVENAAASHGWQRFEPAPDSMLGKMLVKSREMMKPAGGAAEFKSYWRTMNGRRVELTLSAMPIPSAENRVMVGCNIYDFQAPSPSSVEQISAIVGGTPSSQEERTGLRVAVWKEPLGPHSTVRANYVPVGIGAEAIIGYAGEAFSASFFEGVR